MMMRGKVHRRYLEAETPSYPRRLVSTLIDRRGLTSNHEGTKTALQILCPRIPRQLLPVKDSLAVDTPQTSSRQTIRPFRLCTRRVSKHGGVSVRWSG